MSLCPLYKVPNARVLPLHFARLPCFREVLAGGPAAAPARAMDSRLQLLLKLGGTENMSIRTYTCSVKKYPVVYDAHSI